MCDFREAIEYHKRHLHIAKEIGDYVGEGVACCNLGNAYQSHEDFRKAIVFHEKFCKNAIEIGERAEEGGTYGNIGLAYYSLGDSRKAIEYHERDFKIAIEIGDRAGEGRAYENLGIAYQELGDFRKAIEYHEKHLNIAMEIGQQAGAGKAYGNLGCAYQMLGDFGKAIEYHEKDLNIAKKIGDRDGEGRSYGNLGCAYQMLGDFERAIEYNKKALTFLRKIGERARKGKVYANLGNAYQSLGHFQKAIEYHEKDLNIAKEIGDRAGEKRAYGNLGIAHQSLGDFRKAIEYHEKDLSIALEIGDWAGEAAAYGNLGVAYLSLYDFLKAIEYHEKRLNIAVKIGDRIGEGMAYANLGCTYQLLGDFLAAIEITIAINNRDEEGEGYLNIGRGNFFFRQFEKAVDNLVYAVEVFNTVRSLLKRKDDMKMSFREQYEKTYTALWTLLLKIGKVDEALFAAEQGRAQTLSDNLLIQYKISPPLSAATDSIDSKATIIGLLSKISAKIIFLGIDKLNINIWFLGRGRKVEFRQTKLQADRRDKDPIRALVKSALKKIRVGDRVLCENRTLDELTSDCLSSRDVSKKEEKFSQSSENPFKPFHDAVIDPISEMLGPQDDELVIVSHSALCFIPWAAVLDPIRIRSVPSLTSYHLILNVPKGYHKKTGALLVGNPYLKQLKKPLDDLPFAQKEVEMIATILRSRPLTGRQATKAEVMKRISGVGLIHIAAHGDKSTGEIALSPNPGWTSQYPEEEDYILKMSDVQAANLRASLVVLSCCHSGQGKILKGEGVVGIARAFLAAGARCVLVSLWAIEDDATMVFMKGFYQHLKEGKTASSAVHESMKSLRESEMFSAMKHWAPFQVIGDDVKIEFGADDVTT